MDPMHVKVYDFPFAGVSIYLSISPFMNVYKLEGNGERESRTEKDSLSLINP